MAEELVSTLADLRKFWHGQGLISVPASLSEVEELERRVGGLPPAYTQFLRELGIPIDEDRLGFRFWRLEELADVDALVRRTGYKLRDRPAAVVFADYMQESWWYVLWTEGDDVGSVSLVEGTVDGRDPSHPIATFAEFLRLYVEDSEKIYCS